MKLKTNVFALRATRLARLSLGAVSLAAEACFNPFASFRPAPVYGPQHGAAADER
jgi:hypothetical protein